MITSSKIILVSNQGDRSYVIEEHTSDDGRIIRVEGLRENGDFNKQMLNRVSIVEQQLADELVAQQKSKDAISANIKIEEYLETIDLKTVVELTDKEIVAITQE